MRERLFPRWGATLFALLPLSEILYAPVDGQTVYAAILACVFCAILCAIVGRWSEVWRSRLAPRLILELAALWSLTQSAFRAARFLRDTTFQERSPWGLAIILLLFAFAISYTTGLTRCAMWSLPVVWITGGVLLLSCALTVCNGATGRLAPPTGNLWSACGVFLRRMAPAGVILSLSLPERSTGAIYRGWLVGGGLFALVSLRTFLLLGGNTAALLPYPNFSAAGLAALGDFARHGEVFFSTQLILCEVGRIAALGCVCFPLSPATVKQKT